MVTPFNRPRPVPLCANADQPTPIPRKVRINQILDTYLRRKPREQK